MVVLGQCFPAKSMELIDPYVFVTSVKRDGNDVLDHKEKSLGGKTSPEVVPTISAGLSIHLKNLSRKLTLNVLS